MDEKDTFSSEVKSQVDNNSKVNLKSRGWFFTINNPTDADTNALQKCKCRYIIWQLEEGEEKHTPHYQVTIWFENQRVWPKVEFPRASHIRTVWNMPGAIKYCSKEKTRIDGPWERGERPAQGRRTDLEAIAKKALEEGLKKTAEDHPAEFIRYHKGLTMLKEIMFKDRTEAPEVFWLYGKAGTGKSRYGLDNYPTCYIKDGTQWWNGYEQQHCIIIDDFDGKWPYRDLLRLLDRYPYQGQTKGGYIKINSPVIIITCEFPPQHYYGDTGNTLKQIVRRLSYCVEMKRNAEDLPETECKKTLPVSTRPLMQTSTGTLASLATCRLSLT